MATTAPLGGARGTPPPPLLLLLLLACARGSARDQRCTPEEYLTCVRQAGPLLTDPSLIFPDNMADVEKLCRHWRDFVHCVKEYTGRCFSLPEQEEFVRAVQSPVGRAHRLCTEPHYQAEYLEHAFCIHRTIGDNGPCTALYQQYVTRVLGEASERQLCCSHLYFHDCILNNLDRACSPVGEKEATKSFIQKLLDESFSYIKTRCTDARYSLQKCSQLEYGHAVHPANNQSDARMNDPSSPTDNHQQIPNTVPHSRAPDEEGISLNPTRKQIDNAQGSLSGETNSDSGNDVHTPIRPFNYGRSMNWSTTNPQTASSNKVPNNMQNSQPVHSTWKVSSANSSSSNPTEHWNPWGKLNNAVDEPNQQGYHSNQAFSSKSFSLPIMMFVSLALLLK